MQPEDKNGASFRMFDVSSDITSVDSPMTMPSNAGPKKGKKGAATEASEVRYLRSFTWRTCTRVTTLARST